MKIYNLFPRAITVTLTVATVVFCSSLWADNKWPHKKITYEVTITNITKGQTFTPILAATHDNHLSVFELGQPASLSLEILAEGGDTGPLTGDLLATGWKVSEVQTLPGLLAPGASVSTTIQARRHHRYLSIAAMLIPTNDTFVALNSVQLPFRGKKTFLAIGYDAGTEANDQNCANIPGPRCGGAGHSAGSSSGDEGYIYVSNGFHEMGEQDEDGNEILGPETYDWRNPVAVVEIKAVN